MPEDAAPAAMAAVVGDQPLAQRLVGRYLQPGVEAGAHRQPALIQHLLAVARQQFAPHLFGEVRSVDDLRLLSSAGRHRFTLRRSDLGLARIAVLGHPVKDPVAPALRRLRRPHRIVVVGRLRKSGEISRLTDGQLVELLAEIGLRRRRHAIGAGAKIDLVQIQFEDAVLR